MSNKTGYSYGRGKKSGEIGATGDGGPRRDYPKLDYDVVRGQPVVLQFIKFFRDDEDRILHPVPAYVQGKNYWEERSTGLIYSGKKALGRVVPREQVAKWEGKMTIIFRLMSPTSQFGASNFYRRVMPVSAIDIDNVNHTYDLILQGQALSGGMRVLIACGLDVSKACDGPFYEESYIHQRVVENTVDPLTAEQMMACVIEPILLEAVEQRDHMVAGKFTNTQFTELNLDDFKACMPEQVALIRGQLDAAGLSENTVGAIPDDGGIPSPTVSQATTAAPAVPIAPGWQQVTLTVDEIKQGLLGMRDAAAFPEPPNFSEKGIEPEKIQVERLMVWIKMVKPDIRRGKLISQLTHDELKQVHILLNPPAPATISLD